MDRLRNLVVDLKFHFTDLEATRMADPSPRVQAFIEDLRTWQEHIWKEAEELQRRLADESACAGKLTSRAKKLAEDLEEHRRADTRALEAMNLEGEKK